MKQVKSKSTVKRLVIVLVSIGILAVIGYFAWTTLFAPADIGVQITLCDYNSTEKTLAISGVADPVRWGESYRAYLYLTAVKDGAGTLNLTNSPRDDIDPYSTDINFTVNNITLTSDRLQLTISYTIVYVHLTGEEDEVTHGTKTINVSVQSLG